MKFGGHLQENVFPLSIHVAPFLQGEGSHGVPGSKEAKPLKNLTVWSGICQGSMIKTALFFEGPRNY